MNVRHHIAPLFITAGFLVLVSCGVRNKTQPSKNPDGTEINALSADQYFIDACIHFNNANYNLALKMFQKCISLNPRSAAVNYYLSRTWVSLENRTEGLRFASEAWNLSPENIYYAGWYSRLLTAAGNPAEAVRVAEKTYEKIPEQAEMVKLLDTLYANAGGMNDKRISLWQDFRKKEGDKIYILQNLASLYVASMDFEKAHQTYSRIKELSPYKQQAYILDGQLYLKEKNMERALENFEKALKTGNERFQIHTILFRLYAGKGEHKKASEHLYNALFEGNTGMLSRLNFCSEITEEMKSDTAFAVHATETADILPEAFPGNDKAMLYAGRLYDLKGKNDQALQAFRQAVMLGPGSFENQMEILRHCKKTGMFQEQLNYAKAAMEYFPGISVFYLNAAEASNGLRNYGDAEKYCNEGFSFVFERSDSIGFLYELGKSYFGQEQYQRALSVCNLGLAADALNPLLLELSGDAASKLGNRELALQQWKKARDNGSDSKTLNKKISDGMYEE